MIRPLDRLTAYPLFFHSFFFFASTPCTVDTVCQVGLALIPEAGTWRIVGTASSWISSKLVERGREWERPFGVELVELDVPILVVLVLALALDGLGASSWS